MGNAYLVLMILNMQKWHYLNFSISEILKINSLLKYCICRE
ncbi:hypothetical protein HMPREF0776_0393 [Staphylococcus aureus subsp. aureus USA300_TCH959]|nr:hypothetical protein HMPREF0776_0393 [Staphylococcus aureus subsp. aureus USA300_TCH959]